MVCDPDNGTTGRQWPTVEPPTLQEYMPPLYFERWCNALRECWAQIAIVALFQQWQGALGTINTQWRDPKFFAHFHEVCPL